MNLNCFLLFMLSPTLLFGQIKFDNQDLAVTKFRNGDEILFVNTEEAWKKTIEEYLPAYCFVNNDPKQGVLYNWAAVNDPRKLAPIGWKIPIPSDYSKFKNKRMHSGNGWINSTYPSSFNSDPKGYKTYDGGIFLLQGEGAFYWTNQKGKAKHSKLIQIWGDKNGFDLADENRRSFCSVRCVRDYTESIQPLRIDGDVKVCEGQKSIYTIIGGDLATDATWKWYFKSGSYYEEIESQQKSVRSITIDPDESEQLCVRFESDSEKGEYICKNIEVYPSPELPISLNGSLSPCYNQANRYEALGEPNEGTEWIWSYGNKHYGSGWTKFLAFKEDGYLQVKAKNEVCESTSSVSIKIELSNSSIDHKNISKYLDGNKFRLVASGGTLGDGDHVHWSWYVKKNNGKLVKLEGEQSTTLKVSKHKTRTYIIKALGGKCSPQNTTGKKIEIEKEKYLGHMDRNYSSVRGVFHWGLDIGYDGFTITDGTDFQKDTINSAYPVKISGNGIKLGFDIHPIMDEYFALGLRSNIALYHNTLRSINGQSGNYQSFGVSSIILNSRSYNLGGQISIGLPKKGGMHLLADYDLTKRDIDLRGLDINGGLVLNMEPKRKETISFGFRFGRYRNKKFKVGKNFDILCSFSNVTNRNLFNFSKNNGYDFSNWNAGVNLRLWIHGAIKIQYNIMFPQTIAQSFDNGIDFSNSYHEFSMVYSLDKFK